MKDEQGRRGPVARATWVMALLVCAGAFGQTKPAATQGQRFIKEIEAFEEKDRTRGKPAPGGIEFLGSSTIRIWDLKKAFPDAPVFNRGFGGSHISDSVGYFDRIVAPYKPKEIVFYAGDNDIAAGKSPEVVAGDLEKLIGKVRKELPECRVMVIGIKPSVARWKLADKMREANRLMQGVCERDGRSTYVYFGDAMLGEDGKPKAELFKADGLHMNERGYEIWNKKLRPFVEGTER